MGRRDNATAHKAIEYDLQIRQTIAMYDWFNEQVQELVAAACPAPNRWLDTGCGTGTLISQALARFPDTCFVLADPSVEMLKLAANKLGERDAGRVRILPPVSTQELKLPDGDGADVITAIQAHHYLSMEQRLAATRRCFELLAAGGLYIVSENIRAFTDRGTGICLQRAEKFQLEAGKNPADAAAHRLRFDREYFPITVEEHLRLYRECGFAVVEMLWYSYGQAGFYCLK